MSTDNILYKGYGIIIYQESECRFTVKDAETYAYVDEINGKMTENSAIRYAEGFSAGRRTGIFDGKRQLIEKIKNKLSYL